MSKDDLMDAVSSLNTWGSERLQVELDRYSLDMMNQQAVANASKMRGAYPSKVAARGADMQAAKQMLASAQVQQRFATLAHITPALAEVNNPDSPMALTIPTMLALWKQRHGHKWVSEEQIVKDTYWAVIARRLHGLQMLERMEASIGSTWDKTLVFRLKDDEHGY